MNRLGLLLALFGLFAVSFGAAVSPYCEVNNCLNGGTCRIAGDGKHFCTCFEGYYGGTCEHFSSTVDHCEQVKCLNGGTCYELEAPTEALESFYCVCKTGYFGNLCQDISCNRKQCTVDPCLNGATCIAITPDQEGDDDFKCYCKGGWTGEYCQSVVGDDDTDS